MKFRLTDYLYPFEIYKLYRGLQKSWYFSREELNELQNARLRLIIEHAYHHVPYYRELFDDNRIKPTDIQSTKDLIHIPVLTKDIIRERFDDLIADNSKKFKPYVNKTSGSTGTPLKFMQDKNVSIARFSYFWRIWQMAGYKPYMKWAQIDGMLKPEKNMLWSYNLKLNSLQLSAFFLDESNCLRIIEKLKTFKPKIIRGYPNALYTLARFTVKNNINIDWQVKSIITYSETLHDFQKETIERVFGCKVFDVYSLWEAVCLISECKLQNKHQHMEFSAMEVLDESNNTLPVGNIGEITATSFYNFAMPFIRYKTGDLTSITDDYCDCGIKHTRVEKINGRKQDMLFNTHGDIVPVHGFLMGQLIKYEQLQGLLQTQIIQNCYHEIDVKFIVNKNAEVKTIKEGLTTTLIKRLGEDMNIRFFQVEEIPVDKNGKARFIINNLLRENK